jgi:hypothetical protein
MCHANACANAATTILAHLKANAAKIASAARNAARPSVLAKFS